MSRTDKTVPYRVHLARAGRVMHDHRFGPCDIEDWTPDRYWVIRERGTSCRRVEGKNYFTDTLVLFPRTKAVQVYRREAFGRERAELRRKSRDVLKTFRAGGDVLDIDVARPQHRHGAQWDAW